IPRNRGQLGGGEQELWRGPSVAENQLPGARRRSSGPARAQSGGEDHRGEAAVGLAAAQRWKSPGFRRRSCESGKPDAYRSDVASRACAGNVAGSRTHLIVTTFARTGYLRRALEAGASGYLLKDMRAEELADAVRRVHQGLRVIHPELATEAWGELDPLTDRERQVLRLAGEGMASGDIAGELGLSDGTVRNYLSEAISKLGASNRVEAARIARNKGWL